MTLRLSALQSVLGGLLVALAFLVDPALGHAAVAAAAIAAVRQGTRGLPPAHRRPWQLLAGVQVVWACSDALGTQPAGAALRLTGYLAAAAALAAIVHQRRGGYDVVDSLDNLAVGAALALLWWAVFARPALEADIPLLRIALPAAAAVVAAMVVRLVLQTPARPAALTILLAGLACLVAADSATTVLDQWADPSAGAIGVARLAFGLACAAAVLHPSLTVLVAERLPRTELSRGRIVALGLALPTGPAIVAVHALAGDTADMGLLVAGSAVVIGLVLARLVVTVRRLVATHRERDALEQQLLHQARHDVLTGLPNRAAALRATESALHRARRTGVVVALLFIDLDGFKAVNDTHGHAAGDQILIAVADRLRQQVRGGDTAARLGGDEFVVLLDDCGSEHQAVAIAERLVAALAEPVALDDTTTARVGASVGVALSLDGGVDADALLRDADAAVYRVKDTGGHRVEVFSAAMRDEITVLRDVESALRRAIDRHELVLQYQPVVDLRRQAISGFEALVRWQRPDADALPPSAFLRIAEQSALVCELDRWVLYAAAQEASAWPGDVSLTVNISDRSLRRGDLVAVVREALTGTGLPAHRLQLDIRESALADAGRVAPQLDAVRSLGVRIAVDDFGIGHRELDDRVLPLVDVVKTHRSVLADSDGALLEYAVRTAAAHGVEVVVEGVERDEQLRAAAALHCTAAQGHLLGHPVSAAEAMRRLQPRRRPRPRPHARERGVERCLGRDPVVAPLPR